MTLFYFTLLVLATLFWGYLFYKRDYHPQPLKVILKSFGVGLFSMVPVFAYKTLYQQFLPQLSEFRIFRPLLDSPFLAGTLVFVANLILLSIVLFGLSAIISLILNFFSHATLINLKNALKQEPLGFTAVSLLLGLSVFIQQWILETWGSPLLASILGTILFLAIIEEYIKHLIVRITDDKQLKDIDDAITLSIIVGLAFAFIETIIYSLSAASISIIFYRMLVSLPIHVVASGIFGYYYGLAHFSLLRRGFGGQANYHINLWGMGRHGWLHRILTLKKSTVYSEEKIVEGILFATLFHAAMNLLFEFNLGVIAVPFIIAGLVLIARLYAVSQQEQRKIRYKVA